MKGIIQRTGIIKNPGSYKMLLSLEADLKGPFISPRFEREINARISSLSGLAGTLASI